MSGWMSIATAKDGMISPSESDWQNRREIRRQNIASAKDLRN